MSCQGSWGLDKTALWAAPGSSSPLCYGDLCYRVEMILTSLSWTSPVLERQDFRYFRTFVVWGSSHPSAVLKVPAGGWLMDISVLSQSGAEITTDSGSLLCMSWARCSSPHQLSRHHWFVWLMSVFQMRCLLTHCPISLPDWTHLLMDCREANNKYPIT